VTALILHLSLSRLLPISSIVGAIAVLKLNADFVTRFDSRSQFSGFFGTVIV